MSELHLFILWENALYKRDKILKDIKTKFEILNMYNITWDDEKYSENLSRFYGTKLPDGSDKEKHCGRGTFLLVVVKDNKPKYDYRQTTAGKEYVNINMFDSKVLYREWTGGGHKVHCTNSIEETNHDLTLLLNQNSKDYLKDLKKEKNIIDLSKNLLGANGFESVNEMFYALNNCSKYAILRNYEILPEDIYVNEHNDIDIICNSRENVAYILNAKKVESDPDFRVRYCVKVNDKFANFDLRYIGDNYYDKDIEERILKNRIFNEKGFYTLSNEDYFYTLLYHAVIHKAKFAEDYKKKLIKLNSKFSKEICDDMKENMIFLEKWMVENRYIVVRPDDLTVGINTGNLKYMSKLVYKDDSNELNLKVRNRMLEEQNQILVNELSFIKSSKIWKFTQIIRNINSELKKKVENL